jgi:hypothetical protein
MNISLYPTLNEALYSLKKEKSSGSGGAYGIISSMKIEFYPTIGQALETLKRGEVLYTNSWFVLNPLRIWYGKDTVWHMEGSIEYEQTQYVPRVIEEERLTISDKLRLEAKKKPDSNNLERERGLYVIEKGKKEEIGEDIISLSDYYCFRKEEIEDLIENLISLAEKNKGSFKEPMRKAITLGLRELRDKAKGKDFIISEKMQGQVFGKAKELEILDHLTEHLRNPILMALEEDEQKKEFSETFEEFWETNFLDIVGRIKDVISEKIRYVNEIEKKKHGLYGDKKSYFWSDVVEVVDKEPGLGRGRLIADIWEKDRILGLEFGGIAKLKDLVYEAKKRLEKEGRNYAEEIFPEVLGSINLYLPAMPKPEDAEVAIIPFSIKDKNKRGDKEVEFLTLVRLGIKDKEFDWKQANTKETEDSVSIWTVTQLSMRIMSKKELPKELTKGKGKVLVKPTYSENIKIINAHVSEKRGVETELKSMKKQALLKEVEYISETRGLTKSLVIDVDNANPASIVIKDYDYSEEERSIDERIRIGFFLSKSISPKIEEEKEGMGCLGDEVDKIIKEELEQLAAEIKEYAKGETRKEERAALESASLVARRASEVLKKGNVSHSTCVDDYGKEAYIYNIYPKPVEGYRPIIEDREISALRRCCNPLVVKKYEILFNLFNSKPGNLCFDYNGVKANITVEEMHKIFGDDDKKETTYLRKFTGELLNMFDHYVNRAISENPRPESEYDLGGITVKYLAKISNEEEAKEANNLSLLLSGAIASSMLIPWEEKFPLMKGKKEEEMIRMVGEVYKIILTVLTGGVYKYSEQGRDDFFSKRQVYWSKRMGEKSMINEKKLLKEMIGVVVKMKVTEGIEVFIPGYGKKKRLGQEKAGLKAYYNIELPKYPIHKEETVVFYLETGIGDRVVKVIPNISTGW